MTLNVPDPGTIPGIMKLTDFREISMDRVRRQITRDGWQCVPIHAKVIGLGFLDYHAAMVERGEQKLFPEVEARQARALLKNAVAFPCGLSHKDRK